ncbi:MAG TPA: DddA-like double-stranded DNA deaminase toxin [Pseudonocardiaceae bacterium]
MVLLAVVVGCWWVLSWGDSPFACGATSRGAADECPADVSAAAGDRHWAEQRIESIIDEKRTTGLFFWDDGDKKTFVSGEDEHAERATEAMRDAGVLFPGRGAPHPAAAHVETKVAAWMEEEDITSGVVVINNERGPCGVDGQGPFSCAVAVRAILSEGSSLAVWFPGAVEPVILNGERP